MKQAVVYDEHTLGLLNEQGLIEPLASSIIRGAPFKLFNNPFAPSQLYRRATLEDFKTYRVKYNEEYILT